MTPRSLLAAVALSTAALVAAQPPAALTVRLTGVPSGEGVVLVAVYASDSTWLDGDAVAYYAEPDAAAGEVVVEIPGVAPGRFAVAAVHDADASGDMTTGVFGIPEEAYGFSNGARGTLGPPTFEAAAVLWEGVGELSVEVKKFGG